MSKVHLIGAALCAAAGFALPQAASAAIWTTTYQGVVSFGRDIGTFAVGNNELDGLGFTAIFVTDSSAAGAVSTPGPNSLDLRGAGVVSASLMINNHTLLLGPFDGRQTLSDNGIVQRSENDASVSRPDYGYFAGLQFVVSGEGDGDFNTLPAGAIGAGDLYQSRVIDFGFTSVADESSARLLVTSADTTYQAAVPEPQTWALLLLGFGTAGATLRHRRGRRLALR